MKPGFVITLMQCESCNTGFTVPPTVVPSIEAVEQLANLVHTNSNLICTLPKLMVAYTPVLVSDVLVATAENAIVPANGIAH